MPERFTWFRPAGKLGARPGDRAIPNPALIAAVLLGTVAGLGSAAEPAADGVELEDCRISAGPGYPGLKARCGILLRPLDPDDDNSPLIDLNVAVIPALTLEPEADAFVPIAGGPGGSTIEFYAAWSGAFENVRRDRDIVLLDQRGTGSSAPLDCELDEDVVAGEYSAEETLAATRECLARLPHDPRYFTTSVAVRDLEALRVALGYAAFNVYGSSYGTRVAQHYARRYPGSTRSVILDGVVPPTLPLGPDIAIEAQRALDAIFARCAESAECAAAFPELETRFAVLKALLEAEPATLELPHPTTGRPVEARFGAPELAGAVRLLSYHPSSIALIPLLVAEAADGNLAPLVAQHLLSSSAMADALSFGMHNAVVCTEDVPFIDVSDETRAELAQTYIGPLMLDALQTICSAWPAGVIDADLREPLEGELPVLLLSGEADPITPPAYAELAAAGLRNAAHLVGRGQGHGLAPRGCVPRLLGEFVASASVAELDTDCLDRQHAMPFFLDFTGPAP